MEDFEANLTARPPTDEEMKVMALTALAENCEQAFTDTQLDTWLDLLRGYTSDQVDAAIRVLLRTFPDPRYPVKKLPPFSIMQAALDRVCPRLPLEKAIEMAANCQWMQLQEEMRKKGQYREPELTPTSRQVVNALGGWTYLCMSPQETVMRLRRTFIDLWQNMADLGCKVEGMQGNTIGELQSILRGQLPAGPGHLAIEQLEPARLDFQPASTEG